MKILVLLLSLLASSLAFAEGKVTSIHRDDEVLIEVNDPEEHKRFLEGERVIILSASRKVLVAIGFVRDTNHEVENSIIKIEITEMIQDFMIMPGDTVEILGPKIYKERKIIGLAIIH